MAMVFRRSRSLTIDDSFHRQEQHHHHRRNHHHHHRHQRPQQEDRTRQPRQQWRNEDSSIYEGGSGTGIRSSSRKLVRSNSRRLVRSSSISREYMSQASSAAAGEPEPSSAPKDKAKRKLLLRSVVGFLSRTKSGKASRHGSFTITEPTSPASAGSLSRTNSESSTTPSGDGQEGEAEGEEGCGRDGAQGQDDAPVASRPRVSFSTDVTTVFIEQMKEEEVRNTFYCRREYAAFKEAYRMHRDTSTDWCRGNDVLPCNCDACQDDLVEGFVGQHIYSSAPKAELDDPSTENNDDQDKYDSSSFDEPAPSSRPSSFEHEDGAEAASRREGQKGTDETPSPVRAVFDESSDVPSPVGAVFQDHEEDSSSSTSSSGSGGGDCGGLRGRARVRAPPRAPVKTARPGSACVQGRRFHTRSRTWGMGSVPIAAPPARVTHRRGGSLDDWGVSSSVREAVRCHGEGYAYKTLRLQGFSDLYIKTHFLPER